MTCLPTGLYDPPTQWPNCTATVLCGPPPDHPVNGSRTWLFGMAEGRESWDTKVRYQCQHGRQFDTDGDGAGDSISVDIREAYIQAFLSLVQIHEDFALIGWIMMLLMPPLLCHKDTVQLPPTRGFSCNSLVLYGIRVASMHRKNL